MDVVVVLLYIIAEIVLTPHFVLDMVGRLLIAEMSTSAKMFGFQMHLVRVMVEVARTEVILQTSMLKSMIQIFQTV
jgi:hypothetical protein